MHPISIGCGEVGAAEIKIKNLYLERSSSPLRKDAPEFIPGCGVVGASYVFKFMHA